MQVNEVGPGYQRIYEPAVALRFFKAGGKPLKIRPGATLFAENDKARRLLLQRDKMYLLLTGEVDLFVGRKLIGRVARGEVFGEMAPIGKAARSASAIARTECRMIALDEREFRKGLRSMPEFALMLMGIMIARLRESVERLRMRDTAPGDAPVRDAPVFDSALMNELTRELADNPPIRHDRGAQIITEGQTGVLMYVVLEGEVAASIHGDMVERIGPGGVFGEIALVDAAPRVASAVAATDCSLLAINRNSFLGMVKSSPEFGISLLGALVERTRSVTARLR